jgi:hypothetical protein
VAGVEVARVGRLLVRDVSRAGPPLPRRWSEQRWAAMLSGRILLWDDPADRPLWWRSVHRPDLRVDEYVHAVARSGQYAASRSVVTLRLPEEAGL